MRREGLPLSPPRAEPVGCHFVATVPQLGRKVERFAETVVEQMNVGGEREGRRVVPEPALHPNGVSATLKEH